MSSHRYGSLLPTVCVVLSMPFALRAQQTVTSQPSPSRPTVVAPERVPVSTTPSPTLDSLGMRGFSVALVVGEMQGSSTPDTLPAGARKALTDMRDFLPYKSYRMLDAQWTLCCAGRQGGASGRLRGLEEEEYSFEAYITSVAGSKLNVTFRLRETPATPAAGDALTASVSAVERERTLGDLVRQRADLATQQAELAKKYGDNHPQRQKNDAQRQEVHRRIAEIERMHGQTARGARSRSIMENTFSMDVGETVVIGTSRLKGDKALIALLTAASRTSGAREP